MSEKKYPKAEEEKMGLTKAAEELVKYFDQIQNQPMPITVVIARIIILVKQIKDALEEKESTG